MKTLLITGGTSGIGEGLAKYFLAAGPFALQYLSRYILSNRIAFNDDSFILNVATPGIYSTVNFDDLEYRRKFNSVKANANANRLNDLLGAGFKRKGVRYILYNPMAVRTTGARSVFANPLMRTFLRVVHRLVGHEVGEIVNKIVDVLQESKSKSFSAYKLSKPVDLSMKTFDPLKAKQLVEITRKLLLTM